jgi:WD40 repeat protein
VKLWDATSLKGKAVFRWGMRWVNAVAFSPSGMNAAACGNEKTVTVWDVDTSGP